MQVLQAGHSLGFFKGEGGGKKLKVYNMACGCFLQRQSPRCAKEDQKNCYVYMWRGC